MQILVLLVNMYLSKPRFSTALIFNYEVPRNGQCQKCICTQDNGYVYRKNGGAVIAADSSSDCPL
mgnify:CR=1 FL=1